jgi:PAS domain S-box-containing protein
MTNQRGGMRMSWRRAGATIAVFLTVALSARHAGADDFLPHAVCYLWDRSLLLVHAVSDFLIGVSYVVISATLAYLVYRARRDIPFHSMVLAFGAFIVACGATHFMELWTLWEPRYWLAGGVKVVTAIASLATAVVLPPLVPKALSLVRSAHLSRERERVVRRSETRFRALLESAPDGIVIADRDGRIAMVNRQAELLFGYEREELLGREVETLLPEHARMQHVMHRAQYVAAPAVRPMGRGLALSGRRKDGTEFPAEISLSPLETDEGLLITAVVRDVTERRRAEEQQLELVRAQAARAEAEAANRTKDQFLATISHELRTPLNAVYGWAKMLRAGNLDDAGAARAVEVIERNAGVQVKMIDDLLDVSRITTGKLQLDVGVVDPRAVVEAALDVVAPAAAAKQIRLQPVLDPRAGPLMGDADRLQQVVWNLLSNSVKFTPKGGRIQVHLRRVNSHVEIAVADSGEGIDPALLPVIFDRLRQGTGGRRGGLGIGLSLVRHLVELHGGEVSAHSDGPGQGAVFVVKLPVTIIRPADRCDSDRPADVTFPVVAGRPLEGLRVLAAEDDVDSLELLRAILTTQGAAVTTAVSGTAALDSLTRGIPDIVLSDIEMPGGDGYALIRAIRTADDARWRTLPAVALTAYGRVEDRVRLLSAGFNMHLPKPVDPSEVAAVILSLTRRTAG